MSLFTAPAELRNARNAFRNVLFLNMAGEFQIFESRASSSCRSCSVTALTSSLVTSLDNTEPGRNGVARGSEPASCPRLPISIPKFLPFRVATNAKTVCSCRRSLNRHSRVHSILCAVMASTSVQRVGMPTPVDQHGTLRIILYTVLSNSRVDIHHPTQACESRTSNQGQIRSAPGT